MKPSFLYYESQFWNAFSINQISHLSLLSLQYFNNNLLFIINIVCLTMLLL